ncbi:MAG TPA: hypothetical protein ENG59_00060 [Chloroflexi bacterium]|nr:MAG: hypothetical protein DRI46_08165 [Chloroflexota bacterium]HDD54620.1 hypothetical protein [Chloroflexota bacterium]
MKYKPLSIIKAVVCLAFGPALLLNPGFVLGMFGVDFCEAASLPAKEYGAALLGNMLLAFLSRNAEPSKVRKAIIWDLFIYDLAALVAVTILQLQGSMNFMGWGVVFIYLFFSVFYGILLLPKKSAS